jgi:hypothetical protein
MADPSEIISRKGYDNNQTPLFMADPSQIFHSGLLTDYSAFCGHHFEWRTGGLSFPWSFTHSDKLLSCPWGRDQWGTWLVAVRINFIIALSSETIIRLSY